MPACAIWQYTAPLRDHLDRASRMDLSFIYRRSARGNQAVADANFPMSAGFKRFLAKFDGKANLNDLRAFFPHLDDQDTREWAAELIRLGCIESADAPSPVDPVKLAPFAVPSDVRPDTGAQKLQAWAMDTAAFAAFDPKAMEQTTRMATIEAKSMTAALGRDGAFIDTSMHEAPQARRSFSILVVEDEPSQAAVLKRLMEREGHTARLAANRAQILEALNQLPLPELILLDVELPDTNGFHVLEKVRAHAVLKSIPVVMVTGRAAQEDVAKGVMLGANGYVTKPYRPPVLIGAVNRALGLEAN